jgi:chromosome segregation ATPase
MTEELKTLRALPKAKVRVKEQPPPPLEFELPSKRLARLNAEHAKTVEELQKLKREWAAENMAAQIARITVASSRLAWVEKKKGELAQKILDLSTQIGSINREIRANNAARHGGQHQPRMEANGQSKTCPFKSRADWPQYFLLAAKDALTPELYAQIERGAKGLMEQSRLMGIDQ